MKKLLLVLMFVSGISQGATVVLEGGENTTFSKISVSSSTVATLSAYSSSRLSLECYNSGTAEVYVGSSTAITSQGSSSFEVSPSTGGTNSHYKTNGREGVFGIAKAGSASVNVYCIEHR